MAAWIWAIDRKSQSTSRRCRRPEEAGWLCVSMKPGTTVFMPRSSFFVRAQVRLLIEQVRGHRGCGLDRLHRRHAVFDHVGEFLGLVFSPGETAGVGAEADLDALLYRFGECFRFELHHVVPDGGSGR